MIVSTWNNDMCFRECFKQKKLILNISVISNANVMKCHSTMKDLKMDTWAKLNAAFTLSNRLDQLSARQLDEHLYGQTVDSNGWNDSWMDVYLTQLLM